jgi:histidine ammonia-lyase
MHHISPNPITLQTFFTIVEKKQQVALSDESRALIQKARTYLDDKMRTHDAPIYGINTGFGSLCDVRIDAAQIEQLQTNLVMSHACGIGDEVPAEIVRLMLLLKVQSLAYGYSGVQVTTCERLLYFYNNDILPVVYQQGSLGASGDLAPLAHLCLPLLGLGEVHYAGERMSGAEALRKANLQPIRLQSKEGLALLNGTQFSLAYSLWCMQQTQRLSALADVCAALSADVWHCRTTPFDARLHTIRNQTGQMQTAENIRKLLENSAIAALEKPQVQDPYSFRCVPQVHGASKDAFAYAERIFTNEANAVTDNPNVFVADDEVLSGGNFHAQPLALALDFLAIALAELGSISERRTYLLISGQRGLPTYLAQAAGLNSGLMIPQYTAASIVSQNKQLCTPASIDSIVSSNGQEDHVSMAANAATKCLRVVQNVERILAIEWLNATQALEFRRPMQTSPILENYVADYRKVVSFAEIDRVFSVDMHATVAWSRNLSFDIDKNQA